MLRQSDMCRQPGHGGACRPRARTGTASRMRWRMPPHAYRHGRSWTPFSRTRRDRDRDGSGSGAYGKRGTRCCCSGCRFRSCCGSPNGGSSVCCSRNRRAEHACDRGTARLLRTTGNHGRTGFRHWWREGGIARGIEHPVAKDRMPQPPTVGVLRMGDPGPDALPHLLFRHGAGTPAIPQTSQPVAEAAHIRLRQTTVSG